MKWILKILLGCLLAIFLSLFFLFYTSTGSQLVWQGIQSYIPGLQGSFSGYWGGKWQLKNIHWEHNQINQVSVNWNIWKLLVGDISITQAVVRHPILYFNANATTQNQKSESDLEIGLLSLFTIHIENLSVKQLNLSNHQKHIQIRLLSGKVVWKNNQLCFENSKLHDVKIDNTIINDNKQFSYKSYPLITIKNNLFQKPIQLDDQYYKFKQTTKIKEWTYKDSKTLPLLISDFIKSLPNKINLPISIKFQNITIFDLQNATQLLAKKIWLSAQLNQLGLLLFNTTITPGKETQSQIQIKGSLHLQNDYDLAIEALITAHHPLISYLKSSITTVYHDSKNHDSISVLFKINGSLKQKIKMTGQVSGAVKAHFDGEWNLSSKSLHSILFNLYWEPIYLFRHNTLLMTFHTGSLKLYGHLNHYNLIINSTFENSKISKTSIKGQFFGDLNQLSVKEITLNNALGNLTIQGQLSWNDSLTWRGRLKLKDFNIQSIFPMVTNGIQLNGLLLTSASYKLSQMQAQVSIQYFNGKLINRSFTGSGRLAIQNKQVNLEKIALKLGKASLNLNGNLSSNSNLKILWNIPDLSFLSFLKGSTKGAVLIKGNQRLPEVEFQINGERLQFLNFLSKKVNLSGRFYYAKLKKDYQGHFKLLATYFGLGEQKIFDTLDISGSGTPLAYQLTIAGLGPYFTLNLITNGSFKNDYKHWDSMIKKGSFSINHDDFRLDHPTQLRFNTVKNEWFIDEHSWNSSNSHIKIHRFYFSPEQHNIHVDVANFPLDIVNHFINKLWKISGFLNADFKTEKNKLSKTQSKFNLNLTPGQLNYNGVNYAYQSFSATGFEQGNHIQTKVQFDLGALGKSHLHLDIKDYGHTNTLSGFFDVNLSKLEVLMPIFPDNTIKSGQLIAKGQLSGTLTKPLIKGESTLTLNNLAFLSNPFIIDHLKLTTNFNDTQASLKGMLEFNKQKVQLLGEGSWFNNKLLAQLNITGHHIKVLYPGIGNFLTNLNLTYNLQNNQTTLKGIIDILQANIELNALPNSAVNVSPDVVVTNNQTNNSQTNSNSPFDNLLLAIQLKLGDQVHFVGYGLKTDLTGSLALNKNAKNPLMANGVIILNNGKYRAFGQHLQITEGKFIFTGILNNPIVNITAIRDPKDMPEGIKVGLKLSGGILAPKWETFSEPNFPESERLSYLLRGQPLDSKSNLDSGLQLFLLGLGIKKIETNFSSIADKLGLKDLELETYGSGDDAKFGISSNISNKVKIRYGVGIFNNIRELIVQYQLSSQIYLQAVNGLAYGLDIFYHFAP